MTNQTSDEVKFARKTAFAEGRENGYWIGVCAGLIFSYLLYWSF